MVESFFKYLQFEKRVSLNTVSAYQNDLQQFTSFLQQYSPDITATQADHNAIRSWIIELVEAKLDARSVNRKIACLRTFFKFLMRQEIIAKDPMRKIVALKTKKKLPGFVQESDMIRVLDNDAMINTFAGIRDRLVIELFYGTGMRLSELLTLRENQTDLISRTIKVLGKRNKERVIPFNQNLVSLIESYRTVRNREVDNKQHGLLIVTESGDPCYPMLIYRIVKSNLQHATAEKKSPHVLRHTYATHLLNKGAEINAVKDLLGHSSLAATQIYTHNSIEKIKRVFEQAHPKA